MDDFPQGLLLFTSITLWLILMVYSFTNNALLYVGCIIDNKDISSWSHCGSVFQEDKPSGGGACRGGNH